MTRLLTLTTAAVLATGAAYAQTNELPPERAPAAQRFAPPAKIAPPMNAGEQPPGATPGTTGQAPQRLAPGSGENTIIKEPEAQPPQRGGAVPDDVKDDKAGTGGSK